MPLAQAHDYTLQLPEFEGPLDVLLRLIQKNELEITAISLAVVADQYLEHIRGLSHPQPGAMAEFLALAAQLLLIKSRSLLPRPEAQASEGETESAEQLAEQLREYQRIKAAADQLRKWEQAGLRSWERTAAPPSPAAPAVLAPQHVNALIQAIERRLALLAPQTTPHVSIPRPRTITINQVSARIFKLLQAQAWCSFDDLLEVVVQPADLVVTLWTVLEYVKREYLYVEQAGLYANISIGRGARFDGA